MHTGAGDSGVVIFGEPWRCPSQSEPLLRAWGDAPRSLRHHPLFLSSRTDSALWGSRMILPCREQFPKGQRPAGAPSLPYRTAVWKRGWGCWHVHGLLTRKRVQPAGTTDARRAPCPTSGRTTSFRSPKPFKTLLMDKLGVWKQRSLRPRRHRAVCKEGANSALRRVPPHMDFRSCCLSRTTSEQK